jgi:hypothetical protein
MNASIARAAPAVRTGWSGYAGRVRVDVGGIGEVAAGEVVWLLPIGVGAVGGGARCSARCSLSPPPCWVRVGMAPASSTHGTG